MVAPAAAPAATPIIPAASAAKPGGFGASGGVDLARLSKAVSDMEAVGVASAPPGTVAIVPGAAAAFDEGPVAKKAAGGCVGLMWIWCGGGGRQAQHLCPWVCLVNKSPAVTGNLHVVCVANGNQVFCV